MNRRIFMTLCAALECDQWLFANQNLELVTSRLSRDRLSRNDLSESGLPDQRPAVRRSWREQQATFERRRLELQTNLMIATLSFLQFYFFNIYSEGWHDFGAPDSAQHK